MDTTAIAERFSVVRDCVNALRELLRRQPEEFADEHVLVAAAGVISRSLPKQLWTSQAYSWPANGLRLCLVNRLGRMDFSASAPHSRYQALGHIIGKAGLPPLESVWESPMQEWGRLCQDLPGGKYAVSAVSKQVSC